MDSPGHARIRVKGGKTTQAGHDFDGPQTHSADSVLLCVTGQDAKRKVFLMTLRRLLLNAVTALVLAALVVLVLFAHLATLVGPERGITVVEQVDFPPGAWKAMK